MRLTPKIPWLWRAGLLWAAGLSAVGWVLSGLGQLNAPAYAVVIAAGGWGTFAWWRHDALENGAVRGRPLIWRRSRRSRRWRRRLPAGFLVLAGLALLGGLLYVPNNIDALAYRTPRVLHWLAAGRWHWIDCPYQRLNVRATGFEWLTVPVLALTRSDRPLFLLQWGCFLLLPGLVFSTLRGAGVRGVVAWRWMWLFPTGYCFAVQAGGIGNDLYGATVAAAAAALAWRSRRLTGGAAADSVRWSALALALATNAKTSNVLLGLPWLVVVAPAFRECWRRPLLGLAMGLLGCVASIGPQAWLNWRYSGDWTGSGPRGEYAWTQPPGPVAAVVHNAMLWSVQDLLPPINPLAGKWNAALEQVLPEAWKARIDTFAEGGRNAYAVRELPSEEFAGLGAGVAWWLLLGATVRLGGQAGWRAFRRVPGPWVALALLAPWMSVLLFFTKSAIQPNGRILAPFYLWLLPTLLVPSVRDYLSRPWRRLGEIMVPGLVAVVLVVGPARPLFPVGWLLNRLGAPTGGGFSERVATVYRIYAERADGFARLRGLVPAAEPQLGFITGNDAETSLWRPYGQRRLRHILAPYPRAELDRLQVTWVVVNIPELEMRRGGTFDAWLRAVDGEVVHRQSLKLTAALAAPEYAVVQVRARAAVR